MQKSIGEVVALFRINMQTKVQEKVEQISVDTLGILGDKHYNKNLQRTILLASLESYTLAQESDIVMPQGSLGENILIDINPYKLEVGSILYIGDIPFEVTLPCTICGHLSTLDERLPTLLEKDRGIFIKARESGVITIKESVHIK